MTGGIGELKIELYSLVVRAAALEGEVIVCQNAESEEIVSATVCFGPGFDFLGR